MKSITITIIALVFFSIACGEKENANIDSAHENAEVSDNGVSITIIDEWTEYLQSSDDGLWEDSTEHTLSYRYLGHLYDEEDLDIPVYSPFALCCYSDTIFITDVATKQIVAMDDEGSVLWKAGGAGEGPGEFSMMTTLAVSGKYVAALNTHLGRVELFHRDGSFAHSIQVTRSQDIVALDDTTFIVASTEEQGGDLHIVNVNRGIERSFGQVNVDHYDGILRPDLMRLCIGGHGRIAIFNRYEGLLTIYDIETEECLYSGSREYPSTINPPTPFTGSDGETHTVFFPIGGNAFLGPEGMLNVIVCNYMDDGSFISDPEYLDFAPVSAVDRYDWDGNYLDSYCLPDSSINFVSSLNNNRLVARNFAEGVLCLFERY
ncbi:MAG: hypothetical protein KAR40_13350 [Candidatus Sabulitectum sp.]|nr:hypothetical protein [Candidatus Sabulitectum sp.]